MAALISSHVTAQGPPTDQGFTDGFWVCAGVAVLAVVAALALPSAQHRREPALAAGIDDLPPEPVEPHVPGLHLPGHHAKDASAHR